MVYVVMQNPSQDAGSSPPVQAFIFKAIWGSPNLTPSFFTGIQQVKTASVYTRKTSWLATENFEPWPLAA